MTASFGVAILNDEQEGLVPTAELVTPVFDARTSGLLGIPRPALRALPRTTRPPATGPPSS